MISFLILQLIHFINKIDQKIRFNSDYNAILWLILVLNRRVYLGRLCEREGGHGVDS